MKALDYHEATKHSWARIHADAHSLDFENMPRPFKIYSDLARQSLPTGWTETDTSALSALAELGVPLGGEKVPSVEVLARISQTHLGGVSSGADEPGCGSICVALRQSGPGLIV